MKKVILLLLMFSFIGVNATPRELDVKKDNPTSIVKSLGADVSLEFVVIDFNYNLLSLSMEKQIPTNFINYFDEATPITQKMINKLSKRSKHPISIQLPKFTDEYKKDIEDSWLKHPDNFSIGFEETYY